MIPIYHLVEEESGRVIIAAHEIAGFFVQPDRMDSGDDVLILGSARESVPLGRDISDVELRVVNAAGEAIGSYHIGRVMLRSEFGGDGSPRQKGFVATFYGSSRPYSAAGAIWHRWASRSPVLRGEWMEYPVESHRSWLHVVQQSWFEAGREARRYSSGEICAMDGRRILNEGSLFCELGEAVNGVGGYFGSNLDALDDCLLSSQNDAPFSLVWEYYAAERHNLDPTLVASIVDIFTEYGVMITFR
ncbi:barstar family protein [Streptomyces sp. NPDC057746]|uniref:barstar family protein n=1 Tax=Streptomyces sp. NPDC057746 TaxID=3346237 RepID=UPI00368E209A